MKNHPSRKFNRLQFGSLLHSAWSKSVTVENGISGFTVTGIIPLDRQAIPDYAYILEGDNNNKTGQSI